MNTRILPGPDWDVRTMEEYGLIGSSALMRQVRLLLDKVAPTDVPVLVTGPSGSGKEVISRAIQQRSLRKDKAFVIKNCASLQKNLARSELFGHVKGAFTGAVSDAPGLFVEADGGTLFLDEIGDLPVDVQPSLLRALENGTFRPVGASDVRRCDTRLIFATNRNLAAAVEEGTFNEALYHRIHVFSIELPALKDRPEDIPALTTYFLRTLPVAMNKKPVLSDAVMPCLMHYDWPGNVRELRHALERAIVLAQDNVINALSLPPNIACPLCSYPPSSEEGAPHDPAWETSCPAPHGNNTVISTKQEQGGPFAEESLDAVVRAHMMRVLEHCGHNHTQAAERLGISRRTLYRKIKEWAAGEAAKKLA